MSARNWQGIPDWLIFAVRQGHSQAMGQGRQRASEEAVRDLTGRVLAEDPAFARTVVEHYVRSLVRAPKARKRGKAGERERMMADCARMKAEGKSLREIGQAKGISHTAIRKILAEWQTRLPEMDAAIVRMAVPVETQAVNPQLDGFTPQVSSDPNVIPLRRPA